MFSSKTDLWETPQEFFDNLDALFHFTLDACALPENAKCDRYFTPEQDGLSQPWGGRLYGATLRMVEKYINGWRKVISPPKMKGRL